MYPYSQSVRPMLPQTNYQYQQPIYYPSPSQNGAFSFPQPNTQAVVPQISGRVINNISEVMANEVPMDGNQSLFPLADRSCIYAKTWGSDGTIKTLKYILEQEEDSENCKDDLYDMVSKRLDQFESLLTTKSNSKTRKEVTEDVQSK